MKKSGESLPANHGALQERGTWVEQQLGEGWTEVEPGIYRFNRGEINETGIRLAPGSEPASER
jgi:hypothetical protein